MAYVSQGSNSFGQFVVGAQETLALPVVFNSGVFPRLLALGGRIVGQDQGAWVTVGKGHLKVCTHRTTGSFSRKFARNPKPEGEAYSNGWIEGEGSFDVDPAL